MFSDGDLITIFDSSDLSYAVQYSRVLKLTLIVNNPDSISRLYQPLEIRHVQRDLRRIRDQVNHLLDLLDTRDPEVSSSTAADSEYIQQDNLVRFAQLNYFLSIIILFVHFLNQNNNLINISKFCCGFFENVIIQISLGNITKPGF